MQGGEYFIQARLSERIDEVHGGFLLCRDVPIARTGQLLYRPHQLVGKDGRPKVRPREGENVVVITRTARDLFDPRTIRSFEGKAVTLAHAGGWVTPENHKDVAIGRVENVRPGDGEDADKLMADLYITDREAIQAILEGRLREVSCGYEAEYEELDLGFGRQFNIVGNHASILKSGRCGSECAIFDAAMQPNPEESTMAKATTSLTARLAAQLAALTGRTPADTAKVVDQAMADVAADEAAAKTMDAAALKAEADKLRADLQALAIRVTDADKAVADAEAAAAAKTADADAGQQPTPGTPAPPAQPAAGQQPNQGGDNPTLAAIQELGGKLDKAIDAMLKLLKLEAGEGGDAPAEGAGDKPTPPPTQDAALDDADKAPTFDAETIARAEILFPGVPRTADMKAVALDHAFTSDEGKAVIGTLLAGRTYDSADKDVLFVGAAELLRAQRRTALGDASAKALDKAAVARGNEPGRAGRQVMPEEINAANREHYKAAS